MSTNYRVSGDDRTLQNQRNPNLAAQKIIGLNYFNLALFQIRDVGD